MSAVHDLLELALRLERLRTAPPPSLRLHLGRQRDGPREGKPPQRGISFHSEAHNAPQRHPDETRPIQPRE